MAKQDTILASSHGSRHPGHHLRAVGLSSVPPEAPQGPVSSPAQWRPPYFNPLWSLGGTGRNVRSSLRSYSQSQKLVCNRGPMFCYRFLVIVSLPSLDSSSERGWCWAEATPSTGRQPGSPQEPRLCVRQAWAWLCVQCRANRFSPSLTPASSSVRRPSIPHSADAL